MPYGLYYFYQFIVEVTDNMSQVDKLVYVPLLFWFVVLFFLLYVGVFCYLLPLFFGAFKTRRLFFFDLLISNHLVLHLLAAFYFCLLSASLYSKYFSPLIKFCLAFDSSLVIIGQKDTFIDNER
jgi:hypothetical protein